MGRIDAYCVVCIDITDPGADFGACIWMFDMQSPHLSESALLIFMLTQFWTRDTLTSAASML